MRMRDRRPVPSRLNFELRDASREWPEGPFDVVSIIDVMHHVPKEHQRSIIEQAAARLKPGGLVLYKYMGQKPLWRAWMNRLHDLTLVHEWINYVPLERVALWAREAGLIELRRVRTNMFWYGHEMLLLRKQVVSAR